MHNDPIGFFDSGMGGLSVLKTARHFLPAEDFIYYADTANMPYGTRCEAEIFELVRRGVLYLAGRGAKVIALACNTATNVGAASLRKELDVTIVGIEPAVKSAFESGISGGTLVITTVATCLQNKFRELAERYGGENVIVCPSESLASLIERSFEDKQLIRNHIEKEYGKFRQSVSKIVLGCTHFVLVADIFQSVFPGAKLFDGNLGTAKRLFSLLGSPRKKGQGNTEIVTSCGDKEVLRLYEKVLSQHRPHIPKSDNL